MDELIELVFGMIASFEYPTLCCKEIRVTPKVRVLYHTYDGRRVVADCTQCITRQSTLTLYLHNFDMFWICCTTCSCSCGAAGKI